MTQQVRQLGCILFACLLHSTSLAYGQDTATAKDPIPTHDELKLDSTTLKEVRHINVLLPKQYSQTDARFPVLYMLDGGLEEDFPHVAASIEKLVESKRIAPVILVGIENTERRRDLTGPTTVAADREIAPRVGGSAEFRTFVRDELIPKIQKQYRCSDERAIIGESLAGLFVVETLLLEPNLFNRYIAFDPSLWWNEHRLLDSSEMSLKALEPAPRHFWFASSGTEGIQEHSRQFSKVLERAAPKSLQWKFDDHPSKQHSTIFRATKESAMIWALWKLPDSSAEY
ncbi:MAG: alpha/beta hydrolase [Planctomycetaceae bacterium]|nr:alpha/beta hydrolase [Planctomycetaceae bacterium]